MKSCNADRLVLARLGLMSLLTLMILTLSTGRAVAGVEDFKLWKRVEGKQVALQYLKEEKDITEVKDWLFTKSDEGSFKEFVKKHNSEPFRFAQGVFKAAQKAITDNKFKEFRTAFLKNMDTVKGDEFWGKNTKGFPQEAALKRLLSRMLRGDKAELTDAELTELSNKLKGQDEESFLKDAFGEASLRADLALEDTKESTPPADDPSKPSPFDQKIADIMKRLEGIEGKLTTSTPPAASTTATPPTGGNTAGTPPAGTPPGRVGEQPPPTAAPAFDEAAFAKQCRDIVDGFRRNFLQPIQDSMRALLGQATGASRRGERRQDRGEDDLGKILASGLGDALNPRRNDFVQPQTAIPPTARNDNNNRRDNGIFDAPVPEKQQQEEPQLPPLNFGPPRNNAQPTEVNIDIPTYLGKSELADARQVLRESDPNSRTSPIKGLNPQTSSSLRILTAKNKLAAEKRRVSVAASNARESADTIQQQLETLSKGAEGRLNSSAKRRRDELAQEIKAKQDQLESTKREAPAAGNNIEARQALQATVSGLQQELTAKQNELNTLNNTIKSEVENGDAQIKGLAARFQQLNQVATKLESAASEVNGEYELATEMAEQRKAYEDQLAFGQQQPAGVRNVYSGIPAGGNRSNPPPRAVTAGKNPQLQSGTGPEIRKPLSGVK